MALVKRGEVWLGALGPTIGSEIRKTCAYVVVSPPEMHDYLRTAIVAPMTTGSHPASFRAAVRLQGKDGLTLLDQLRTLDKRRLVKHLGNVRRAKLDEILGILQEVFAP